MCCYLTFRKGGINILDYSRSTNMFQALSDCVPYEEWGTATEAQLLSGIDNLREKKTEYENRIKTIHTILNSKCSLSVDDAWQLAGEIQDLEEKIKGLEVDICEVNVLLRILDEKTYKDDETELEAPLEWRLG